MAAPAKQYSALSTKRVECAECTDPKRVLLATASRKGSLWIESNGKSFCTPAHYSRWLAREGQESVVEDDVPPARRWFSCLKLCYGHHVRRRVAKKGLRLVTPSREGARGSSTALIPPRSGPKT